jgi:hypothetical protein
VIPGGRTGPVAPNVSTGYRTRSSGGEPVGDVRPEAIGATSEVLSCSKKFFSDRDSKTQVA